MLGQAQMRGERPAKPSIEDPNGEDPREAASPEEQAAYEAYVSAGMEIILGDDGDNQPDAWVLALLRGEYDDRAMQRFAEAEPPLRPLREAPVDALAAATVSVLLEIEDIAAQGGGGLQDEVIFNGASEIMGALADIADGEAIFDYSENDLEVAFYRGVDLYRVSSGRVDQENLKQEFGAFVQADQAGGAPAPAAPNGG